MTTVERGRLHRAARPGLAGAGRQRRVRQRRAVRRAGEPHPARARAVFAPEDFGHKGKVYDGWETRRRREPGHDRAIVRLGVPGVVRGVVVDTAWFRGNYPPYASVEAAGVEGHPSPDELAARGLGDPGAAVADQGRHGQRVPGRRRAPVHPRAADDLPRRRRRPVPRARRAGARPARCSAGTVDLAALEHGGDVVDCSDRFYSSPRNLLLPGRARSMGEGWENARRRDDGNDHVTVRLGRARSGRAGRGRHVVLRRQRARLGLAAGRRRGRQRPGRRRRLAWSWCRGPGCSPTPGTCSGSPGRRR